MLKKLCLLCVTAAALTMLSAMEVRAQAFFSPFVGYDFGGDSGCHSFRGCEDKKLNMGIGFGSLGQNSGFEQEFAYAKHFFGEVPGRDSSVLTLMSNFMIAPKIGPVRPYGLFGVGLMKTNVELSVGDVISFTNNHFAWDVGGGIMVFFGEHFGIRGDLRRFQSFQDLHIEGFNDLGGFTLDNTKLDYGRASVAIVLK
jgi:hypothetical protein